MTLEENLIGTTSDRVFDNFKVGPYNDSPIKVGPSNTPSIEISLIIIWYFISFQWESKF